MQFVPQIVNGLMKLGLHHQASPENRKLSLDLAGLVIYWEQRRLAESRAKEQQVGNSWHCLWTMEAMLGNVIQRVADQ